jgi:hypothetical protein
MSVDTRAAASAPERVPEHPSPAADDPPIDGLATLSREALERFVYMVGSPRGGTTIIYRSFRLNDKVFDFPGITYFMSHVWSHRRKVHGRLLRRIFQIPTFYNERAVLESLDESHRSRLRQYIRRVFAEHDLGRMYQLYPLLYALDPNCGKDPAAARCWVDKANDVSGLFDIPKHLPQAKFVFITRDPRGAVASLRRQDVVTVGAEDSRETNFRSLISSCIYWRHMMQTLLRFARRYPDRTIFVRFEDFILGPEDTVNGILQFVIGEGMSEAALREGMSAFKHSRRHDSSARGHGIDARPMERWREMLSADEVGLVAAIAGRTARKLGYDIEPSHSAAAQITALARVRGWRDTTVFGAKLAYLGAREPFVPRR